MADGQNTWVQRAFCPGCLIKFIPYKKNRFEDNMQCKATPVVGNYSSLTGQNLSGIKGNKQNYFFAFIIPLSLRSSFTSIEGNVYLPKGPWDVILDIIARRLFMHIEIPEK